MASLTRIWRHPAVRQVVRYAPPFLSVVAALVAQGVLQQLLPKGTDFPYTFFYLIAVFVSAWFGYIPGALACLLTSSSFRLQSCTSRGCHPWMWAG